VRKTIFILAALSWLLPGCGRRAGGDGASDPAASATTGSSAPVYRVTVQKVPVYLEATGSVQSDLEGGAKILPPLSGSVSRILVRIGDAVRKGDPLAAVRSAEMNETFSAYLSSAAQLRDAERRLALQKELLEIGAITRNDVLESQTALDQAKAANDGFRRKLDLYGVGPDAPFSDEFLIRAPIDGRVADISAHVGDRIDPSIPLLQIVNPAKVMVVVNIYDTDLPKIKAGQAVAFTTDVFPDVVCRGVVAYISDIEDADAKTVKTFLRVDMSQGFLKPNMFLKIKILLEEKLQPVIAKTCLIYRDGKFYVHVRTGGGFELREVRLVREVTDKLVAVDSLREGEEIAASAIDLEKF
jgi:cobalt-zinc-cadmium efflux system membrane fusion protein